MTPYLDRSGITLYHGDCREILPTLSGADLIFADPPYNYGIQYDEYNDSRPRDEYAAWCGEWFHLARAACKRVIVTPGNGNLDIWFQILKPSAIGCWYKPGNGGSSIIGFEEWEPWLYWHGGNKGLLGGSSVIRAAVGNQKSCTGHPCPKPLEFMLRLLKKSRASFVIDPFAGAGSTLFAAKMLGIQAVGIESSENYCELIANRLSQGVLPLDFEASA